MTWTQVIAVAAVVLALAYLVVTLALERDEYRRCLLDIIYSSDGCVGHKDCNHSIEPWKRARKLTGTWNRE